MIYSLKGIICDVGKDRVAIDLGGIAYEVLVARPEEYRLGQEAFLYCHESITQDDHFLVGFSSKLEKEAFQSLVSVKGIGPKTALSALSKTNPEDLFKAIYSNNTAYLKKLPGIGPKAAAQIILDLQGKLVTSGTANATMYDEVKSALKQLGFKSKEIDDALASISEPGLDSGEVLRMALKKLHRQ